MSPECLVQGSAHSGLSVTGAVAMVDIKHYIRRVKNWSLLHWSSFLIYDNLPYVLKTETTTVLYYETVAGIK